ncbi:FadR/GntR family transcriptional regulator [Cellvibrio japonicus]|uniref:Transcriptional regulator, GntR family n=1 Tax=Cellvibrio japonicus (strain Ueda107) TaxID=498211 RepID=B3PBL0_CELJU|nr:FadR/GntR family transcriptional regulator [Cellvibrio japonicus]ACE86074.1 transcriptional regulator, GntR family [Cellvibrio japonicus Ueda107]QEI13123.1 FadR family transcriptional regulator [Cellvibrio japonicus]QEI16697.1 FadR family transcriptional regulator [Cellvibrio japonicus]QEI20275.1 FadR family transcriptional regulator [Cellvibrio japonicus]
MLDTGRNLTHQLTHQLGAAIVQGQYAIDKSFPTEAELSQQFNISRSVTREAVKMLTAKGLIASRPRQGIRVMPSTHWNMFDADVLGWTLNARPSLELLREFTQLRMAIEPEAAALAAENASDGPRIKAIGDALARMKKADEGQDDPLVADIEFHCAILSASNNRFFYQLRDFIQVALRVSIASTNQLKGVLAANYEDHKRIYDAICAGEREQAAAAVKVLLVEVMDLINRSLVKPR